MKFVYSTCPRERRGYGFFCSLSSSTGLGWIWDDLGCVCCPAAWELLRTGSTCPCQNMHRDIIPCNSLLGQKGIEKSCWLENWMLSMAFHNAVWLISMVKIRQLFPSYTGTTKATIWQTEVGSDGSELCSVTLIILNRIITKSAGRLQTSPTDVAGTISNVRKWCNNSTLRFWTRGSFNEICKEVFLQLLSEMRSICITST